MSKLFVKSLLLAMLTVIVLTACGTASTPATQPPAAYPPPGYPNGATSGTTPAAGNIPGTISFKTEILPIFESRCIKCHGGDKTEKGLDLNTYDSVMKGSTRDAVVVAGDAGNSLLFMNIANGKMPKNGPKLTSTQIELIMKWINAGALNN